MVRFETSHGGFTIELFEKDAPKTVANFLRYVDDAFFDGTVFHRIVPGFVIQGGGLTSDMRPKGTREPVQNEANNGLKNKRGTLSMARTNDIHSATSQFFVNLKDVIDRIAAVSTGRRKGYDDAPLEDVLIVSSRRLPEP
jgi:cyclophilin family peptidyl-prolyl cis-trans isomerase